MNLTFDVKISRVNERALTAYMQEEIVKQMRDRLISSRPRISDTIYNYLRKAIDDSPEILALEQQNLRFDLGVKPEEVAEVKDRIVSIIASTTRLDINVIKGKVEYVIGMVKSDYSDLLSIVGAEFESKNGFRIPWLEWLLLSGHQQVVKKYHVKYVTYPNKRSRSGGALMVKGGSYSVIPSEFTGVASDNFITRSLELLFPEIQKVLTDILS